MTRPLFRLLSILSVLLAGCATVVGDAERLAQAGQPEQAVELLANALRERPGDLELRAALARQRELALARLANQFEAHRAAGRLDAARVALGRLQALDAEHPRSLAARADLERAERHERWMGEAREAIARGHDDEAEARLRPLLAEAPGHPQARSELLRLRERRRPAAAPASLGPAFQKPVTVEYRDAPLRAVLEGLGRTHGVNFVFDKDVRVDTKVSILLKDVAMDDALRVILGTQQLDRKLLNDSTLLIYPNTQAKQREHQELVTRSFFLVNADVKQAQAMVRTLAKTRDLFIDERLNLVVIRDTPEVVRLVEKLLASLDLPEPEVMLEVEVLEISSNKLDELGLQWPEQISYGLPPGKAGEVLEVTRGNRDQLRASVANPALVATLRETVSRGNTLANPRLRARNREKAKILIGEKLPVFASTAATANVAGTTTVTYLDVGIKLDVEPSVQLDNDVVMKVNLEVSTLIAKVAGPAGSVGYQVGTRQASTSLRLRDGETQVLAGLIRDDDTKGISGLPVLADLPLAGRLFGVHTDQRVKSEVVLLITPRVLRNLPLPDADALTVAAGIDTSPGAEPLRLRGKGRMSVPPAGAAAAAAARAAAGAAGAEGQRGGTLVLSTSGEVPAGGTASVTLQNRSAAIVSGELQFDTRLFQAAQGQTPAPGRIPFTLAPGAEQVVVLRALAEAAGQNSEVSVVGLAAQKPGGEPLAVEVQGDGALGVAAAAKATPP
ncbi:secretin N-terminal domain-containing protein [Variovorax sp. YR752]|uniref:secretin N-terminal domain-containing protein n=1 Tax=Variovorax sp. YR752 TaxID=1884383 RepID=UPI00313817A5